MMIMNMQYAYYKSLKLNLKKNPIGILLSLFAYHSWKICFTLKLGPKKYLISGYTYI